MDVKVGDVVHVRGVVESVDPSMFHVWVENSRSIFVVSKEDIVHVEPAALKVGDWVYTELSNLGEIKAIIGDFAWVLLDSGAFVTKRLAELRKARAT